jgi:hypothetical protein
MQTKSDCISVNPTAEIDILLHLGHMRDTPASYNTRKNVMSVHGYMFEHVQLGLWQIKCMHGAPQLLFENHTCFGNRP